MKQNNKNSQLHIYCEYELYNEFKEAVNNYNKTSLNQATISEIVRKLMKEFIKTTGSD